MSHEQLLIRIERLETRCARYRRFCGLVAGILVLACLMGAMAAERFRKIDLIQSQVLISKKIILLNKAGHEVGVWQAGDNGLPVLRMHEPKKRLPNVSLIVSKEGGSILARGEAKSSINIGVTPTQQGLRVFDEGGRFRAYLGNVENQYPRMLLSTDGKKATREIK